MPVVARMYGIRPWEMGRLRVSEWNAIREDVEAMMREAQRGDS